MSLLVIHLPPRPRLHPARAELAATEAASSVTELEFAFSADDQTVAEHGSAAPALLSARATGATQVVAVLGEAALSWHRVTLPKVPAARLRSALIGLLEEELLDEPSALHLAVQPDAQAGEPCWVAVTDRPWLAAQLSALEQAGLVVDRLAPIAPPALADEPGQAHIESQDESVDAFAQTTVAGLSLSITWTHADGVLQVPLAGAQTLLPNPLPEGTRLSATPTAAQEAERWFGGQVPLLRTPERWLAAAHSDWNLRQFELASRHRGAASARQLWQTVNSPAWRPARWGLAGLIALQVIGLNAWAWQQQRELRATRDAMTALLRATHPQVQAILDAPIQMQRETDTLRTRAGALGEGDLERLLQAAAGAWPPDQPIQSLRFEAGQLSLGSLSGAQAQAAQTSLTAAGWSATLQDNVLVLRPARSSGAPQ